MNKTIYKNSETNFEYIYIYQIDKNNINIINIFITCNNNKNNINIINIFITCNNNKNKNHQ